MSILIVTPPTTGCSTLFPSHCLSLVKITPFCTLMLVALFPLASLTSTRGQELLSPSLVMSQWWLPSGGGITPEPTSTATNRALVSLRMQ